MPQQSTIGPRQVVISRSRKDKEVCIGYLDPQSNQEIDVSRRNGFQATRSVMALGDSIIWAKPGDRFINRNSHTSGHITNDFPS